MRYEFDTSSGERVERFLATRGLGEGGVSPLAGDASNRAYYRVHTKQGESYVLAVLPGPFDPESLPFLNVAELFREIAIRVPRIYAVAGGEGIVLLEDLGDELLQDAVAGISEDEKRALYRKALDILAGLQVEGKRLAGERYQAFRVAFDQRKFFDELEFFREHYLCGLRGAAVPPDDLGTLDSCFRRLARELSGQPFSLCHRDYHARNLMLVDGELAVIDFQDARQGPRIYDLVSLLNDSYVVHTEELVEQMKDVFTKIVGADPESEYDVAALQRNLKALGTFGYQIASRGNDVYRAYLDHTLALVRANLERNPRWDPMRRVLARYLPELA